MTALTAVSGATGQLGGRVARRLSRAGVSQRLLVRDAARAPELPGAEIAAAEYADTAPQWAVDGWVTSYAAVAAGELDVVTDVVERLAGHPATDFADYLGGRYG